MEVYGTDKNFLAIGPEHSSLELSSIAIVSAPYEHTVSYGAGTKKGPKGIIKASAYVEFYDDETKRELGLGFFLFVLGFPFCFLAQLGIKRDKKLLDSLNRLR